MMARNSGWNMSQCRNRIFIFELYIYCERMKLNKIFCTQYDAKIQYYKQDLLASCSCLQREYCEWIFSCTIVGISTFISIVASRSACGHQMVV
jgi:hypothetical protein